MKKKIVLLVCVLYVFTWVGGWTTRSLEAKAATLEMRKQYRTSEKYEREQRRIRELEEVYKRDGVKYKASGWPGPAEGVKWCVPILPFVLLMESWWVADPLWGSGNMEIVIYYGFGTKVILRLGRTWVA